jgi:outer membrane immunogenic protein
MKKLLLTGAALSALIAGPAMAADLGARVYRRPVVAVAVYNWTGFYVGANAGYAWSNDDSVNSVGSLLFLNPMTASVVGPPAVADELVVSALP